MKASNYGFAFIAAAHDIRHSAVSLMYVSLMTDETMRPINGICAKKKKMLTCCCCPFKDPVFPSDLLSCGKSSGFTIILHHIWIAKEEKKLMHMLKRRTQTGW